MTFGCDYLSAYRITGPLEYRQTSRATFSSSRTHNKVSCCAVVNKTALCASCLPGQNPYLLEAGHQRFLVAFKVGGEAIPFRFAKHRITPRPGWTVAWMVLPGAIATLVLAWLLARRIAAPVAELARAARRIAKAGQATPLPSL